MIFKAVTAFHRDRFILIIALFNHAVLLILADRRQFQRRNLKRHIAVRFILITALSIPDRSLISITHQPLKRSEFEAAHSRRRNLKRHIAVRRFAILRIAQTIPKAELSAATRRLAVEGFGTVYFFA